MNDRYLFKAKRKDWRELPKELWWIEGYYVYFKKIGNHCIYYEIDGFTLVCYIDISTLCACTGLKDKNEKMIWEGDIVKVHDDEKPCLIEWGEDTARWNMTQYDSYIYDFDNYWSYEVEVIGNNFDNPELLEVGE